MESKKRGRKPKGGRIMTAVDALPIVNDVVQNIILHLKCNSNELEGSMFYNTAQVEPYDNETCHAELNTYVEDTVQQKLKNITTRLHNNDVGGRSDCFWCTCPYDTPATYIPKSITNGQYQVYGSFCCPECAAGYLFQQKLDQSIIFEQYHLLNDLYGEALGYKAQIIPAPPPHYILNKFFGSLNITEYRKSIREDVVIVVNKPISCTYPELIQTTPELPANPTQSKYRLCRKIMVQDGLKNP